MKILYLAGVIPVVLGACTPPPSTLPDVVSVTAAAEPSVARRQTHHRPVITNFERREPTDPKPWRKLNDDQTVTGGHSS